GDQQPGGFLAQVLDRLVDGRAWRVGQGGLGDVVEAHHREILRNAPAGGRGDFRRRYGREVVGGEDGGGPVREGEEVPSSLLGRLGVVGADPHQVGIERDSGVGERLPVSLLPQPGRFEIGTTGQEADASVPQADQILGGGGGTFEVLGVDGGQIGGAGVGVDGHHGHVALHL